MNPITRSLVKLFIPKAKRFKIPVSGTLKITVNENHAPLLISTNPSSFASKHIYWNGLNSFEYIPLFKKIINSFSVFVDIGANTGIYSTLGATLNKNLTCIALEPAHGPFEFLKKNIKINRLESQVFPLKIAASKTNGTAKFYEVAHHKYHFLEYNLGGVGNLSKKLSHRNMTSSTVSTRKLDSLLESEFPELIPDLIKIDTEATEDLVLAGMESTIIKHRPIIICETLYNRIEDKINSFFQGKGYVFLNHVADKNCLKQVDSLIRNSDNGVRDCFIVPKEKTNYFNEFI